MGSNVTMDPQYPTGHLGPYVVTRRSIHVKNATMHLCAYEMAVAEIANQPKRVVRFARHAKQVTDAVSRIQFPTFDLRNRLACERVRLKPRKVDPRSGCSQLHTKRHRVKWPTAEFFVSVTDGMPLFYGTSSTDRKPCPARRRFPYPASPVSPGWRCRFEAKQGNAKEPCGRSPLVLNSRRSARTRCKEKIASLCPDALGQCTCGLEMV